MHKINDNKIESIEIIIDYLEGRVVNSNAWPDWYDDDKIYNLAESIYDDLIWQWKTDIVSYIWNTVYDVA